MAVTVTLYTRRGCHLCEHAKEVILPLMPAGVALDEVDIDLDPDLRERYTDDVPVVAIDGVDLFWHHVDPRAFAAEVARAQRSSLSARET